jgi:hypothetical protein
MPEDRMVTHLSDEFYLALGKVTAQFQTLEVELKHVAEALVSTTDQELGQIITAQLSFGATVALVGALHTHRVYDEAKLTALDAIFRRASLVEQRRNSVTHSDWWPSMKEPEVRVRVKSSARGKLEHRVEPMRTSDIEAIADEASIVAADLAKVWFKLMTEK